MKDCSRGAWGSGARCLTHDGNELDEHGHCAAWRAWRYQQDLNDPALSRRAAEDAGLLMAVEPSPVRGSYAEKLAVAGCCAEHALWALQHGADWVTGWSSCPRPDWLAEAWVLTSCAEGSGDAHRRLVGWMGKEIDRLWTSLALRADPKAAPRIKRCTLAVRAATAFAQDWGRKRLGGPPDIVAFSVSSLFDREEAEWTPAVALEMERTTDAEAIAAANAALRAACSALSGDMPAAAMRALSWSVAWADEVPELSARFAREFPCPDALRCELPA